MPVPRTRFLMPWVAPAAAPSSGEMAKNAGRPRRKGHSRRGPRAPLPVMALADAACSHKRFLCGHRPARPFAYGLRPPQKGGGLRLPLNFVRGETWGWFPVARELVGLAEHFLRKKEQLVERSNVLHFPLFLVYFT
ncbi:MAG: hypothetical protein HQM08_29140 [Candidatus Riflebacteria bacterium]|nr:hypothetical protein [Candidatus Riflebacteria bacterium]